MGTALAGIRVIDFSRVLAGPFCTMLLADYGADVVKVENPKGGDDTRQWGPPWAGELSAYYISINRNKRSITLDLKTDEGRETARRLIAHADILVENFKVGQMREYGLDYAILAPEHPRLIYCSITGYGQTGPYAQRAGYDFAIQAESGLMAITGPADGQPYKVGVAMSDVTTGLFATHSILAALHYREKTGQGQYIDLSLLESQVAALVNVTSNYLISQQRPPRYGNAHPNIVPYQTFEAADGTFVLAVGNDRQFGVVCEHLGCAELATDVRFATNPARVVNRGALEAILQPLFRQKPVQAWVDELSALQIPVAPVNDIPDVLHDSHVRARGLVHEVTLGDGTPIEMVGPAPQLSQTPPTIRRPPPRLGEHTIEVLHEWLGLE